MPCVAILLATVSHYGFPIAGSVSREHERLGGSVSHHSADCTHVPAACPLLLAPLLSPRKASHLPCVPRDGDG